MAEQRALSSRPGSRRSASQGSRSGSAVSGDLRSRTPSRGGASGASAPGSAVSRIALDEEEAENYQPASKEVDGSYSDPLGPLPDRPRTSVGPRNITEEDFADEEIGDDLLPE